MSHFGEDSSCGSIYYIPGKPGLAMRARWRLMSPFFPTRTYVCAHATASSLHANSPVRARWAGIRSELDGNKKTRVLNLLKVSLKMERHP